MLEELRPDPRRRGRGCSSASRRSTAFTAAPTTVVANWMTREDRELAIADNLSYVGSVVAAVRASNRSRNVLVYAGFSQGVAMAYRAAAFAGLARLGGDCSGRRRPARCRTAAGHLPPVLIGRGTTDHWYTEPKAAADLELFTAAGVTPAVHVFEGGHVWDQTFITRAGEFLDLLNAEPREP